MLLKRIKLTSSTSLTKVCIWKCYNVWQSVTFYDICLDVGDIVGVLFRIEHKETFLSKKPKWSLHSISIETCRKLSNEQGTHWCNSEDTFLMISVTLLASPLSWELSCRFELSNLRIDPLFWHPDGTITRLSLTDFVWFYRSISKMFEVWTHLDTFMA